MTHDFRGTTLANGLTRALCEFDLTWEIRDDAIVLTTPEEAEARLHVRIYPVLDLLQSSPDAPVLDDEDSDYFALIDLLTVLVKPTTWDEVGGPSTVEPAGHGCLAISHTCEGFAEIDAFFAAYRRAIAHSHAAGGRRHRSRSHRRRRACSAARRLERRVDTLNAGDMVLGDAVKLLSERLGLLLRLDLRLRGNWRRRRARLNVTLRDEPLGAELRRILKPLHLTWVPRDGAILVTDS